MSASLTALTMEEKAQDYWVMSRQWRGDHRFGGVTVGDLLTNVAGLAGELNYMGWRKCEDRAAELLQQVINNKRCRKRKPKNNIIALDYQRNKRIKFAELYGATSADIAKMVKVG